MRDADVKSKELREEKEVPGGSMIGKRGAEVRTESRPGV